MNSTAKEKQSTKSTTDSFGEKIRQAREERQLSIDDLVRETRIHPQHLIDLELGKTSGISAPGYVVGYLKTLAKVLELDAESLIQEFKSSTNQDIHQTIDPEHELLPPKQKQGGFGWGIAIATSIIVLMVIGALLYYWFGYLRNGPSSPSETEVMDDSDTVLVESESTNPATTENSASSELDNRSSGSSFSSTGLEDRVSGVPMNGSPPADNEDLHIGNGTEEIATPSAQTQQTSELWQNFMNLTESESDGDAGNDSTEQSIEGEIDDQVSSSEVISEEDVEGTTEEEPPLVFEFSDASWVEVTDADENQLISETREAGTTLELDGKAPFTVKLGFAPGVTLYFKGSKVDLENHTRRNTAEFTLPP